MAHASLLVVPPQQRSTEDALRTTIAAVALARGERTGVLVSNFIDDDTSILGARELIGSSRPRRATTGRTVTVHGRVLHQVLAVSSVDYLCWGSVQGDRFERAAETFRSGFSRVGLLPDHLGSDFLSYEGRPGTVFGYDADAGGGIVLEAFTGLDNPVLSTRAGQKPPLALCELSDIAAPELLLEDFARGACCGSDAVPLGAPLELGRALSVLRGPEPDATVSERSTLTGAAAAVVRGPRVRLRGDFLGSNWALDRAEERLSEAIGLGELPQEEHLERLTEFGLRGVEVSLLVDLVREALAEDQQRYRGASNR